MIEPAVTTMVERAGLGLYELPPTIDPARADLAEEFLAKPLGRHSEALQLLLGRMRSDLELPRLVVQRSQDGRWVIINAPRRRGQLPTPLITVASREDAERFAFRTRWQRSTGTPPPGEAPPAEPPAALPPAPAPILGYTSTFAVRPGQEISAHVSAPGAVTVEVVRLRSRRPSDAIPVDGLPPETCPAEPRSAVTGSHGRVPLPTATAREGATLQANVCPVGITDRRQVLAAWGDPWRGDGLAIHLEPGPTLAATASAGGNRTSVKLPDLPLPPWTWRTVAASADQTELTLRVVTRGDDVATATTPLEHPWSADGGELIIGAVGPGSPRDARDHFNGRLEQVALTAGRLPPTTITRLASPGNGPLDNDLADRTIGCWDFSLGIDSWSVTDVSPHGRHGVWHNLPRRAVCGSRWDGVTEDWRQAPDQYAAVHLLADALEDAGWPPTRTLTVPDVASGFYAFRVQHDAGEIDLPFVVLPPPQARTPLLLLVPTATYTAYANSRFWWEDPIQEAVSDRLVEVGDGDRTLMARSDLGLSHYDQHADGTDVCHVSDRHPNAFLRADNVHNEGYCSDLDLVEWLEHSGYTWAAVTDRELDRDPSLLNRCQVLLTGTHPEYVSSQEFDEISSWIRRGGRMLYLGGNGFQTRVSFDRERPWITENRRIEHWGGHWPTMAAERRLAADGEPAGYLTNIGRSTLDLLGVESATMGFDESRPYHRVSGIDPRTAFVFADITKSVIGDHGRIGGAVVGQEWDNAASGPPPPDHHILARSQGHSIVPALFGAARSPYHCDMTIRFDPSGGAVFSVGTMTWCAALADTDNDVATITRNVTDRFLDPTDWDPVN